MIEVEIKAHISEAEYKEMPSRLEALKFNYLSSMNEIDVYYNGPDKNYFESGEALRIRTSENIITKEKHSTLTYKGKKLDSLSNTRVEHEVVIDNMNTMGDIFKCLDFTPLFSVEKQREYYGQNNIHVCVDYVKGLGHFIELEKIVSYDSEKSSALVELFLLLSQLGFSNDRLEGRSYAHLLFDKMK